MKIKGFMVKILFPLFYLISICRQKLFPINILDPIKTCKLIASGMSISRIGDGELKMIINSYEHRFQEFDISLQNRLIEILSLETNEKDGFMLGLSGIMDAYKNYHPWVDRMHWATFMFRRRNKCRALLNSKLCLDALFARNYEKTMEHFKEIKSIWQDRKILIIEGSSVKFGMSSDILDNAKSIQRIIVPSKNAWGSYDAIFSEAQKADKETLILIILGHTATVLAYDLFKKGYHAVDFGQGEFDIENRQKDKLLSKQDYLNQIIAVIGSGIDPASIDVSIVTPTYNRANTLPRLYDSLKSQTNQNFEWIIIDDGSQDNTGEVVADLVKNAPFKMRYLYKENGGVHTARNIGVKEATAKYLILFDSDDTLMPDTIEYGLKVWSKFEHLENYYAVVGRCVYENGKLIGKPFPQKLNAISRNRRNRLLRKKYNNEMCTIVRTDIFKRHPMPEPKGVKFVVEGTRWMELDAKYDSFYVNHVFRTYFFDQANQITKRGATRDTLYSAYLYYIELFNRIFKINKSFSIFEKLDNLIRLLYAAIRIGRPMRDIVSDVNRRLIKVWLILFYIPIFVLAKLLGKAKCQEK